MLKSLKIGLKKRWNYGGERALAVLGFAWLLTEVASYFFPKITPWMQERAFASTVIISSLCLLAFLVAIYSPRTISVDVPTTQTRLTLKYGDLFDERADLIIAVNEFFDGALGQIVSPDSIHGQFVIRYFNSDEAAFRQSIDPILAGFQGGQVARAVQPDTSYPIGTALRIPIGQQDAYLVALTKTDLLTHKATTNVANLWIALTNVLESVHHLNSGKPVAMPLIGNGLSGLNLQPQHLLRLLVLAIVETSKKMQMPRSITVVLHESCFEKLDLVEIQRNWRA